MQEHLVEQLHHNVTTIHADSMHKTLHKLRLPANRSAKASSARACNISEDLPHQRGPATSAGTCHISVDLPHGPAGQHLKGGLLNLTYVQAYKHRVLKRTVHNTQCTVLGARYSVHGARYSRVRYTVLEHTQLKCAHSKVHTHTPPTHT